MAAAGSASESALVVAVIGDAFADLYLQPAQGDQLPRWGTDVLLRCGPAIRPGGSAANTAGHLSGLGRCASVALHTAIGDDSWGAVLREHHARLGVQLFNASSTRSEAGQAADATSTGVCVVISGCTDRAFMSSHGVMQSFCKEDLDMEGLRRADHVHIGGFFSTPSLQNGLAGLLSELRANRPALTTSLDTNYDSSQVWQSTALSSLLAEVDVFLPNEVEACGVAGAEGVEEAAIWLAQRLRPGGAAVITCGKEGVCIKQAGDAGIIKVPAPEVPGNEFVDATGAGDAFNACFLSEWIQSRDIRRAAEFGVRGGSLAVRFEGACDTPLTPRLMAADAAGAAGAAGV